MEHICHVSYPNTLESLFSMSPQHKKVSSDAQKLQADTATFLDNVEFRDAALLSFVTSAIIVPVYDDIKKQFGIIRAEYLLLLCLSHFSVLTAQDVSHMTGRPRNSISRAVNRMLREGYIARAPDPTDARKSKLTITRTGRNVHRKVAAHMSAAQDQVLSVLTAAERKTLVKLLRKTAVHVAES